MKRRRDGVGISRATHDLQLNPPSDLYALPPSAEGGWPSRRDIPRGLAVAMSDSYPVMAITGFSRVVWKASRKRCAGTNRLSR
jgi:hypothetical protein